MVLWTFMCWSACVILYTRIHVGIEVCLQTTKLMPCNHVYKYVSVWVCILCMYVHCHVPMCAPVLVTVWVNSRHEYTLNSRTHECPYYCVYRHISDGMLSHGHMFISEVCENACVIMLVCVHMCLYVTWYEWRQIIPAWYHLTSC